MTPPVSHITICICTFRRPDMLKSLLEDLRKQETDGRFTFSIVIVDNDREGSARQTVSEYGSQQSFQVQYFIEPRQNIALARNKAIEEATGDFVVFIDDDESPIQRWLVTLFEACVKFGAY